MTIRAKVLESHPPKEQGGSDGWCSPTDVIVPLREFYGGKIGFDPCSNANSIVDAAIEYTWGAYHRRWHDKGYENPPFSRTDAFTKRCLHELEVDHVEEHVRLTMVATSTQWWRLMCNFKKRNPRLIFTPRLKFMSGKKGKKKDEGARFDTVLAYYGRRTQAFDKAFKHITSWSAWGRS